MDHYNSNNICKTTDFIKSVFLKPIGVGVVDIAYSNFELFPSELDYIRNSVKARQIEFSAGRHCARLAMHDLGLTPKPIMSRDDRSPIWPHGLIGSITHSAGLCFSIVAQSKNYKSVGIDTEIYCSVRSNLADFILTSKDFYSTEIIAAQPNWVAFCFVVKESCYKAHYQLFSNFAEPHDIIIENVSLDGSFVASCIDFTSSKCNSRYYIFGRCFMIDNRLISVCWV